MRIDLHVIDIRCDKKAIGKKPCRQLVAKCNGVKSKRRYLYVTALLVMSVILYTLLAQLQYEYNSDVNAKRTVNTYRCAVSIEPTDSTYTFIESESKIEEILNWNTRTVQGYSCQVLFDYQIDTKTIMAAKDYNKSRPTRSNMYYQELTKNCEKFKHTRGYLDSSFTEIEQKFPIAYSIVAYKDVEQLERLLRAIYRPQNHYCIHIDAKSSTDTIDTVKAITSCFDNVFMPERPVSVVWGTFSVLDAELVCMRELFAKKDWKYFINLTGQEFPLKSNLEIVKILTAMKGANIVDGTVIRVKERFHDERYKTAGQPPHDIRPVKGSVHIAVNRDFVQFALYDTRSLDFLQWLNKTMIPDETFFPSLNHNPHLKVPGSFIGDPEEYPMKPSFTRYKNWEYGHGVWVRKCGGKYVRNVCVLGIKDLSALTDDISLFANKFFSGFEPLAYECLEELIFNRTRDQYLLRTPINVQLYSQLDQVRLKIATKYNETNVHDAKNNKTS